MFKIGNNKLSESEPCFIVAEAGVNHNGNLDLAFKLIDAAQQAGADAIKFQTFTAESLVTKTATMAEYQKANTGYNKSQFEMLKALELTQTDFARLKEYSEKKGLVFISTPFDDKAFDLLEHIGVKIYKVGSGDLTNLPLISRLAKTGKPLIISTGMANMDEVHEAVATITCEGQKPVILHCTSNYPTLDDEVNLAAMHQIRSETGCLVGYSDHTISIEIPALAVGMGAKVIEKHLTLDRQLPGPDHKASIEQDVFREMVDKIRWVEKIMGSGIKSPTESEKNTALVARKSIITTRSIKKGEIIEKIHLVIKRPGSGIKPKYLKDFIGKVAVGDLEPDELLRWEDVR